MAKKEKFRTGGFDLDADLDFDDMDFGGNDKAHKKSGPRTPITRAAKGAIGGAKNALKNKAIIAKAIRAGMPREYGEVLDQTGMMTGEISNLYNDAVKEIKPSMQKMAKQVDKLVPSEMRRTKSFVDKIRKILGEEATSSSRSIEDEQESSLQGKLAEVFEMQAEQDQKTSAEDRVERRLNQKIDAKRFESSFGLLNSINVNLARMSNYNSKINSAYQKKSLELQYRSYFVQQDLLKTTKEFYDVFKRQNDDIVKNTGLPDFVKKTKSEEFMDMTRKKFINKFQQGAGGFLKKGIGNLTKAATAKKDQYMMVLQQALMGLDVAVDMNDGMKMQQELSRDMGEEDLGKAGMAGDLLANLGIDAGVNKLGGLIRKHTGKQGGKTHNFLMALLTGLANPEKAVKGFQSKHLKQNYMPSGFKDNALNKGKGLLDSFISTFLGGGGGDEAMDKHGGHTNLRNSADFNQMTQKSITTIIPGYLARIHRELVMTRTNTDKADLLEYDIRKDTFASSSKIDKSTKQHLANTVNSAGVKRGVGQLYSSSIGGQKLSPAAEKALKDRLHHHLFQNGVIDEDTLKHPEFTKGLRKNVAKEIQGAVGKHFDNQSSEYATRKHGLVKSGLSARNSIGDISQEVQSLIDGGQEATLLRIGVLHKDKDGNVTVAKNAHEKLSKAGLVTSDFFAKKNIKGFSGKSALEAIKKMPIAQWMYRKGKGDGGEHIGPMAQDVNKQLGNEAAPNGKALDLMTMNGVNMAAIGELHNQVKGKRKQGINSIYWLRAIEANTAAMITRLDGMAHLSFGIPKFDAKGIQEALKAQAEKAGNAIKGGAQSLSGRLAGIMPNTSGTFSGSVQNLAVSAGIILSKTFETLSAGIFKGAKTMKDKVLEPAYKGTKNLYNKHKDTVMDTAQSLFSRGTDLVKTIYDKASNAMTDLIQNKLPAGYAQLAKVLGWAGRKLKNVLDEPTDVYVKGQQSPALRAIVMAAGGYLDQKTGKPIMNPGDIKGPVVDYKGNLVLSIEDIHTGLVDGQGRPITSILKKLGDAAMGAISHGIGTAKEAFKALSKAGAGIGERIKGAGSAIMGRFRGFGSSRESITLLTQIRDLLNMRLPGKRVKFAAVKPTVDSPGVPASSGGGSIFGSIKDKFNSLKDKVSEGADKAKEKLSGVKTPGFLGSLFGSIGGLANKAKGKFSNPFSQGNTANDQSSSKERAGGTNEQMALAKARTAERIKNTKVASASLDPRYKGGNVIDAMLAKVSGAYDAIKGGLGSLGEALTMGGKGGLLRKGAKLAGKGLWGATKLAAGGLMGAGRLAIGGAGMIGSALASTSAGAAVTGALSSVGGAAMTAGTIMPSIGGALVGGLGGLATFLASPVGLGIAATALAGYGLYKGFKFLTRNKASNLTKVRMVQYGLSDGMSSHYHDIYNLESYLIEHALSYNQGQAQLVSKQIDPDKIFEIFDVSKEDQGRMESFLKWFQYRFKPVFLTHLTTLYAVNNKLSLAEVDKLQPKQADKYLKSAAATPSVYAVTASPFKDPLVLSTNDKDVTNAVNAARDEFKDKLDDKDEKKVGIIRTAFNFLTKSEALDAASKAGGIKGALATVAKYIPGAALAANIIGGTTKMVGSFVTKVARFITGVVTTLEKVRFKSYGLKSMKKSKISSLRNLEEIVSAFIKVEGNNNVKFVGDINEIIKLGGAEFGISSTSDPAAPNWTKWFSQRFLPVFSSYIGSGFQLTGKKTAADIEPSLKGDQKYAVAVRLTGVNDIWSKDYSPWSDEQDMCTSSDECKDYLQELKDQAKDEGDRRDTATKAGLGNTQKPAQDLTKPPPVPDLLKDFSKDNKTVPGSGEGEKANLGQAASAAIGTATMTAGKVAAMAGNLANPDDGDAFITLAKGAKLNGVNPELMKNLKMMAAEYGKLTGKSIVINSGSRDSAEQERLYKQDPSKAAKPGTSLHEFGLALDVNSGILDELDKMGLMRKYGFTRPVGGETWHMEPAGIQPNIGRAKKDPEFAKIGIQASLGVGGSGYGAIKGSAKGRRNSELAMSLLEQSASAVKEAKSDKDAAASTLAVGKPKAADEGKAPVSSNTNAAPSSTAAVTTASPAQTTIAAGSSANASYGKGAGFSEAKPSSSAGSPVTASDTGGATDVKSIIAQAAKETGADPATMLAFAAIESGLNPSAKASTSSATGLFQFTGDTWKEMLSKFGKKYNLDASASPTDARANALMGGEFLKMNAKSISSVKPNPTATDLYIAHFLGAGGARKFFKADPSAIGADVLPDAAKANKSIFYDKQRPRTIGEIYNLLNNKVSNAASRQGVQLSTGSQVSSSTAASPANKPGVVTPSSTPTPVAPNPGQGRVTPEGGNVPATSASTPPPRVTPASQPSVLSSPGPSLPGTSSTPTPQANNLSLGGAEKSLGNIDQTLTQSLNVQKEMADLLRRMVSQAANSPMQSVVEGMGQVLEKVSGANKGSTSPSPAVSLQRRIR